MIQLPSDFSSHPERGEKKDLGPEEESVGQIHSQFPADDLHPGCRNKFKSMGRNATMNDEHNAETLF